MNQRVGIGYDAHQLITGRKLILGGVEISHETGLLGHSDADVLTHAIIDALIGAMAAGSIGEFFPDNDQAYKDINSLILLEKINTELKNRHYKIINIDSIIVAEKPKLTPHIPEMRQTLAKTLGLSTSEISVKAKTTETMGFEGRREGMSSQAVVLIAQTD